MLIRSIILTIFGGLLLLLAVRRLRQFKLKERYALIFLIIGLPFLALAIWPRLIELAAEITGIAQQTVMILCLAIFLILMVFELLTIVSMQDRKITQLAQYVGILMHKLEEQNALRPTQPPESPTNIPAP